MRRFFPVFLALHWLLETARVSAETSEPFALEWTAPHGCVDGDQVRARIQELAGSSNAAGAPLRAEATVTRQEDGELHLHLVVRADNLVGERDMVGRSCDDLAGATAVALALLLRSAEPLSEDDLTGRPLSDASTPAEGVAQPAPTALTTAPPRAAPASAPAERGWRGLLQVPLVALGVGPLRELSVAVALAAGASFGPWYLLADGRVWLPQNESPAEPSNSYGARVQRFAAGLRGCRAFAWQRFQLAPCIEISAEHMSARGTGSHVATSEASATWVAVAAGAQGRLSVTRWFNVVAGVDLQVETSRPILVIEGLGAVEQLRPVALVIALGSEWIL